MKYEKDPNPKRKGRLIQNLNHPLSPTSHLRTHCSYRERRFPIFLTRNEMAEEKKVPFGGYPREEIQWRRGGPVAQRIRARGYEPRCRGFESLLAHSLPKGEGPLLSS